MTFTKPSLAVITIRRREFPPPNRKVCLINRASSDLVGGRVRDLKALHFGSAVNHLRQGLQDLGIRLAAISLSVVFFIPKTNGDCFITLRGNEADLILESFLSSEQGNDLSLKNAGKLRRALRLQFETHVVTIHFNLLN
jgi:hypothetical protein